MHKKNVRYRWADLRKASLHEFESQCVPMRIGRAIRVNRPSRWNRWVRNAMRRIDRCYPCYGPIQ